MSLASGAGEAEPRGALFRPLDKPPSAQTLTVRKLLGKMAEGRIRVPSFQRPLRWGASDVVQLFDSILRGYPVGSLLFWKKSAPREQARVGGALIPAAETDDAWYVVDGQQRTTALAAALLELDHRGDRRWEVYFDPARDTFCSAHDAQQAENTLVPGPALGDLRRLGRFLRDCGLGEEQQRRVEEVQQRVLDYELPAYVVETDDVDALRGVFARLNSTGVRMRADEVFQALLGPEPGRIPSGRRHAVDLAALQAACDVDRFGQPPRPEVLKALLAMSGLDPSHRLDRLREAQVERLIDEHDAAEALRRAAAFIQAEPDAAEPGAGIPCYGFLPYPVAFVLLSRWFHSFPDPDAETRRELSRWLWRGVVTGVHQRAAVSKMRYQVREIEGDDAALVLRRLHDAVGEPDAPRWGLDPFHAKHAASRVEVLTLLAHGPRDPDGPVSWLALATSGERVAREVFRPEELRELGDDVVRLGKTVANRVLLDARHTGLRGELVSWSGERGRQALESHLIDDEVFDALRQRDAHRFLSLRASKIRAEVSRFLVSRAGIGQPRLLSLSTYYESPEAG